MLEEVRITGLGVIDDAVLELSPGFTVVTGETGAGKTMVVTGLGLVFGGRADPARVRPGAARARITWVEPTLRAEIEFAEWTRDVRLRAPVFVAMRADKDARDIVRERAASARDVA